MIVKVSREQAAARRQQHVTPNGATTFIETYMGTNAMELAAQGIPNNGVTEPATPYPMAYRVEQAPDCTIEAHYHQVDQFQIFIGGVGRIGTHAVQGVTVHYAGAHSPYGPIVSGPEGVQYVTLRRSWDPGARWMPGAAAALREVSGRKHLTCTSQPLDRCPVEQLVELKGVSFTELITSQEGAIGAWLVRAGPGAAVRANLAASAAQFWYVLSGGVLAEASKLGTGACIFVSGDQEPFELSAAAEGVELVLLQFSPA